MRTINFTSFTESAAQATNFAMAMRKRIEGSKIASIEQSGSDRIIIIRTLGHESFSIVIEMYGKGNVILLDQSNMIVLAYKVMDQKNRTIRVKRTYDFPATTPFEFGSEDNVDKLLDSMDGSGDRLITALSSSINLGPLYVEDIITSSGLSTSIKSLDYSQKKKLRYGILRFYQKLKSEKPRIYVDKSGEYVDYSVVSIEKYSKYKALEFESLGSLLDKFYVGKRSESIKEEDSKLEELKASIEQQKELIGKFETEGVEYFEAGNTILNNMAAINQVIAYLRENRRATLEEVKSAFPGIRVDALDLKEKTIEIEI